MRLTEIEGLGEAKADRLRDMGYECVEDVAMANLNRILSIKGIGPEMVRDAQRIVGVEGNRIDPDRITYRCECGMPQTNRTELLRHRRRCIYEQWSPSEEGRVMKEEYLDGEIKGPTGTFRSK